MLNGYKIPSCALKGLLFGAAVGVVVGLIAWISGAGCAAICWWGIIAGVFATAVFVWLLCKPGKTVVAAKYDNASAANAATTAQSQAAWDASMNGNATAAAVEADAPEVKAAEPAAKPKKAAAPKPAPTPAADGKSVSDDDKPELLSAARDGGPDDLKMIKGVGPKMEGMLHKMGVFHFDQVASWKAKEVSWVDDNLEGFKGRVSRDEWVKQAKILAKGGTTEFSKKASKGGVYKK